MDEQNLIYDWNLQDIQMPLAQPAGVVDETLRDGLQSPSVRQPPVEEKLHLLHMMADLGVDEVDIGLPATGDRFFHDAARLAQEIADAGLPLKCYCAARTVEADIRPVAQIADQVGRPIGVAAFIGSSPIRQYAEDWSVDDLLKRTRQAVTFAVQSGLRVLFVTEDTTRSDPDTLRRLYGAAIECGAETLVLSDTTGHATPHGTRELVRFMRAFAGPEMQIDWHGHRDRGLATANALAAVEAGANRIHATGLGIGERTGNTSMEQVLVNLKLMGYIDHDLRRLSEYCALVSQMCSVPLPGHQPIVGGDAFRTSTGVHAAAVVKAMARDTWLADRVYAGVPAAMVGQIQAIEIGPMSGASNVRYMLGQMGVRATDAMVTHILRIAKRADHVLSETEILRAVVEVMGA